jgi:TRAP-type uncharacterized transport system fused permease subunit
MDGVFSFLAGSTGRIVRIVAGVVLVVIGIFVTRGALSWVLVIVGLVPLLAGLFDRCVFAPLFGLPFVGPSLREALQKRAKQN